MNCEDSTLLDFDNLIDLSSDNSRNKFHAWILQMAEGSKTDIENDSFNEGIFDFFLVCVQ